MNPRQRRGVIFMLLAGVAALVLFFVAINYVGSVNAKIAPTITIYQADHEIPAYAPITDGDVRAEQVPKKWASPQAVTDKNSLIGRRASFNIARGTYLGSDMLLPPSDLNADEREIALTVDSKTGIAGRIRSGDLVDVYAVFGDDASVGVSRVLCRGVRVVSVRGVETRNETTSQNELQQKSVIPVTLALSPEEALQVTFADSFAKTVRLVGLSPEASAKNRSNEPTSVNGRGMGLPKEKVG